MKPLSKANFIGQHYESVQGKPGVFANLFQKKRWEMREKLNITMTYYNYLEAETFIEDLKESVEENIPFYTEDLINLLYVDFVRQIREFSDLDALSKKLIYKKELLHPPAEKRVEFTNITPNHGKRMEIEVRRRSPSKVTVTIEIQRKAGLRGEVLLMRMSEMNPGFFITLEELISILVNDFLEGIQKGQKSAIMESIIERILDRP